MDGEPHSDRAIAEVLARLDVIDPAAAIDARAAIEWLVGDAGIESLSRYAVQQFCWYELPFKWIVAPDVRREIVVALARFFDLAGLSRYADLCRSPLTRSILDRWEHDSTDGYVAYRRASRASGVEPPDLPDLVWGQGMGPEEFAAFWSTAMALELALDSAELVLAEHDWPARQLAVARAHLSAPRDELLGESWLQSVWTARLADWIQGPIGAPSRARAQLLAPVANALLHPIAPPRGLARSLAPMTWLIEATRDDGVALTRQGNLTRVVVNDAVTTFPRWWPQEAEPRREDDVLELATADGLAREMRLVRRSGRRLRPTRLGLACLDDVTEMWSVVAGHAVAGPGFLAAVAELVFAVLLIDPLIDVDDIVAELMVVLTESGWQDGSLGAPVSRDRVEAAVEMLALRGVTLGWVRRRGVLGRRRKLRLTDVGRATALAALRARALAPRAILR